MDERAIRYFCKHAVLGKETEIGKFWKGIPNEENTISKRMCILKRELMHRKLSNLFRTYY